MSPRSQSGRRRGGQPGNANALKFGLFARKYHPAPVPEEKVEVIPQVLNYDEETELLRQFFLRMLRLDPDKNELIDAFPVFRRVINIAFLQAAGIRAHHPLTAADYENLSDNLEQLLRLILNR